MIGPAELVLKLTRAILPRSARRLIHRKTHQFNRIAALAPSASIVTTFLESEELRPSFERYGRVEVLAAESLNLRRAGGSGRAVLASPSTERLSVVPIRRRVSLISTCRNEAGSIESWLESIRAQDVYPDEVVICDAGSTDGTRQKITRWYDQLRERPFHLKVIDAPGANIARGRNLAVQMSHGELLLFTDAGCVLESSWVRRMQTPFSIDRQIDLVIGWYQPSFEEHPIALESSSAVRRAAILRELVDLTVPRLERIDPSTFLPSARSMAVTRLAFTRCGGFPEYLTLAGEDSLFDYYLKSTTRKVAFVPEAEVKWTVPKSIRSYFKMLFRYSRGDAEGGKLFWNHYRFLIDSFARLGLDLVAAGFLLLASILISEKVVSTASLILGISCLVFAAQRIFNLAQPFQPLAARNTTQEKFARSVALAVMLTAQAAGFVRGLIERPRTEAQRLWSASAGYMFVFGSGWCENERTATAQEFVERSLSQRHFVVYVSTDRSEGNPILHPRLEQYPAEGLDLRRWLKKHRSHLRAAPTIVLAEELKNVEASKLLNSLRSRFPDSPIIELS